MSPNTDEATARQLEMARHQGEAYGHALKLMTGTIAETGAQRRAGDFLVGYAIEEAEGLYTLEAGGLVWHEPEEADLHVEVAVRDAADGRFVPGLDVSVTMVGPDGADLGTHRHDLVWHPMIYHYARNWSIRGHGRHRMRVDIAPPMFRRHDRVNGCRFAEAVSVEFDDVEIAAAQD